MAEKNNNDIHIDIALKIMAKLKINQRHDGILAITIQKNRTGNVDTMVIDCGNRKLLELYPNPMDTNLEEKMYEDFIITWKYLPTIGEMRAEPSAVSSDEAFCCKNFVPYKPIRTEKDQIFNQFVEKTGTLKDFIFKVAEQVDNGPLISTKYFKLFDSQYQEIKDTSDLKKIHSFKNYKCRRHNRFFALDLYSTKNTYNGHHMRAIPRTSFGGFPILKELAAKLNDDEIEDLLDQNLNLC